MANLSPAYIELLEQLPEAKRRRFLLGQFADAGENSLWSTDLIDKTRIIDGDIPEMLRIVIAVDPSGCAGPEDFRSDEVGIAVCGLGTDSHAYLLEDLSGRHGPEGWGSIVVGAYERWNADRVVAEKNYGGDMVRAVVQSARSASDPNAMPIPFTAVTATRGKVVRAEPISALYVQGKVHHVGRFDEIEDQMNGFTTAGYMGLKSPDRADALVWGVSHLFSGMTKPTKKKTPVKMPTMHNPIAA